MEPQSIINAANQLVAEAQALSQRAADLAAQARTAAAAAVPHQAGAAGNEFLLLLTVFVLACFVGYYVVWRVTPALHSPLMSVTNAVSSVIIVGALIAAGTPLFSSQFFGFLAVALASVNIFGGFIVTQRMLAMYKKKSKK